MTGSGVVRDRPQRRSWVAGSAAARYDRLALKNASVRDQASLAAASS
jgi:hypothetical protein